MCDGFNKTARCTRTIQNNNSLNTYDSSVLTFDSYYEAIVIKYEKYIYVLYILLRIDALTSNIYFNFFKFLFFKFLFFNIIFLQRIFAIFIAFSLLLRRNLLLFLSLIHRPSTFARVRFWCDAREMHLRKNRPRGEKRLIVECTSRVVASVSAVFACCMCAWFRERWEREKEGEKGKDREIDRERGEGREGEGERGGKKERKRRREMKATRGRDARTARR